jgi:hypothetical protein
MHTHVHVWEKSMKRGEKDENGKEGRGWRGKWKN